MFRLKFYVHIPKCPYTIYIATFVRTIWELRAPDYKASHRWHTNTFFFCLWHCWKWVNDLLSSVQLFLLLFWFQAAWPGALRMEIYLSNLYWLYDISNVCPFFFTALRCCIHKHNNTLKSQNKNLFFENNVVRFESEKAPAIAGEWQWFFATGLSSNMTVKEKSWKLCWHLKSSSKPIRCWSTIWSCEHWQRKICLILNVSRLEQRVWHNGNLSHLVEKRWIF